MSVFKYFMKTLRACGYMQYAQPAAPGFAIFPTTFFFQLRKRMYSWSHTNKSADDRFHHSSNLKQPQEGMVVCDIIMHACIVLGDLVLDFRQPLQW